MTVRGVEPDRATMVEVNRVPLRLWEWGDPSAPLVLCAHGGFDHGRMFDGLAPFFVDRGFRVVAPDLRAHGDSSRVPHGHTFTATVADLGALLVGEGRPAGLVGHSMGASLAFEAAAAWPEHTAWVVSLDGLGPPLAMWEEGPEIAADAEQRFEHMARALSRPARVFPTRDELKAQRGNANLRLPADWLEHLVAHGAREVEGGWSWKWDPLSNTSVPDGFRVEWLLDCFTNVTAPTLVLTGAEPDLWSDMSIDEIDARLAHFPDAIHHRVADAGHYVHLEAPAEVERRIASFLDRVGPGGRGS